MAQVHRSGHPNIQLRNRLVGGMLHLRCKPKPTWRRPRPHRDAVVRRCNLKNRSRVGATDSRSRTHSASYSAHTTRLRPPSLSPNARRHAPSQVPDCSHIRSRIAPKPWRCLPSHQPPWRRTRPIPGCRLPRVAETNSHRPIPSAVSGQSIPKRLRGCHSPRPNRPCRVVAHQPLQFNHGPLRPKSIELLRSTTSMASSW